MEKIIKVTIETAFGQIIVRNDKGAKWKFSYRPFDTSVAVAVSTIATSMLNATLVDLIKHQLDNNETISFTLIQETN